MNCGYTPNVVGLAAPGTLEVALPKMLLRNTGVGRLEDGEGQWNCRTDCHFGRKYSRIEG